MSYLEYRVEGHVAHLTLNAPEKLNAMGPEYWDGMPAAIDAVNEDRDVRALVLSGAGRSFTAGLDLMAMMPRLPIGTDGKPDGRRQARLHQLIRDMQRAITVVERCRVPVVAAVHGHCIGGGIDLITACDVRLCAADARFSVREVKLAMVADIGTLQRLPAIVGQGHARELALTGRDFDAAYAERIGLVNRVLPDREALMAEAQRVAEEIAGNPPLAVEGTKRVMNEATNAGVDRGLEYVATWNAAHLVTQDLGMAVAAFVSKEKPEYSGR
jgi:enoyl-CoA hydratase